MSFASPTMIVRRNNSMSGVASELGNVDRYEMGNLDKVVRIHI